VSSFSFPGAQLTCLNKKTIESLIRSKYETREAPEKAMDLEIYSTSGTEKSFDSQLKSVATGSDFRSSDCHYKTILKSKQLLQEFGYIKNEYFKPEVA